MADVNHKDTELRLGLPGTEQERCSGCKRAARGAPEGSGGSRSSSDGGKGGDCDSVPVAKAQMVGWPPIPSCRRNSLSAKAGEAGGMYVKVSMDGAPYLRKIDLKIYKGYSDLLKALETMFKFTIGEYSERDGYEGSEYVPAYEDKDGDLMLVGDVPWDMFMSSCKRLRIMKASEAKGLGCGL